MIIGGRYRILRTLQGGSSGKTFLAEDVQEGTGSYAVVKQLVVMPGDVQTTQLLRNLVRDRLTAVTNLSQASPYLPKVQGSFEEAGRLYIVREWTEGVTLTCRVQKGGVLSEPEVEKILFCLLEDLVNIHQAGTFHGNIKPSNIILRQRDDEPVFTDFNLLPVVAESSVQAMEAPENQRVGAFGFIPPEQQAGQVFFSSDLYSLGLTAIYLLTGKLPQELPTDPQTGKLLWHSYAAAVSPEMMNLLDGAVQLRPEERFATAAEMLAALEAIALPPDEPSEKAIAPSYQWVNQISRLSRPLMLAGVLILIGFSISRLVRSIISVPAEEAPIVAPATELTPTQPEVGATSPLPASPGTSPEPTTAPTTAPGEPISQAEAVALVNQWLAAKQQIFSPPFNRELAAQLTTAALYQDITKAGGSMDWLMQNNARYEFRESRVESVQRFGAEGDRAVLEATVTENRTLYVNNQIDPSQSGTSTATIRYTLYGTNGTWQIADYQVVR